MPSFRPPMRSFQAETTRSFRRSLESMIVHCSPVDFIAKHANCTGPLHITDGSFAPPLPRHLSTPCPFSPLGRQGWRELIGGPRVAKGPRGTAIDVPREWVSFLPDHPPARGTAAPLLQPVVSIVDCAGNVMAQRTPSDANTRSTLPSSSYLRRSRMTLLP